MTGNIKELLLAAIMNAINFLCDATMSKSPESCAPEPGRSGAGRRDAIKTVRSTPVPRRRAQSRSCLVAVLAIIRFLPIARTISP